PFGERWQIEAPPAGSNTWSDLADGPILSGAATASNSGTDTLTITATQAIAPVRFRCRVSNACGSTNSSAAILSVPASGTADGNGSGTADGDDVQAFVGILVQGGSASVTYCAYDMNGDGVVNTADVAAVVSRLLN